MFRSTPPELSDMLQNARATLRDSQNSLPLVMSGQVYALRPARDLVAETYADIAAATRTIRETGKAIRHFRSWARLTK